MKQIVKPTTDLPDPVVEVVDNANSSLLCMQLMEVHVQRLHHRSVVVLLYGADNKIWLQKRSRRKSKHASRWDVSTKGHVHAGESTHDAAVRKVQQELGLHADKLKMMREISAGPETGFEFVTVFSLGRLNRQPEPDKREIEECFYYSAEELTYLVREFRELMTPQLLNMWEADLLFPSWGS